MYASGIGFCFIRDLVSNYESFKYSGGGRYLTLGKPTVLLTEAVHLSLRLKVLRSDNITSHPILPPRETHVSRPLPSSILPSSMHK
jgi:hypothetical protein